MVEPRPDATALNRLREAQLDALFQAVTLGVTAAAAAAVALVVSLRWLKMLNPGPGPVWAGFVLGCALAHIGLAVLHAKAKARDWRRLGWRSFAAAFTFICLAEGVGWGFAPLILALPGDGVTLTLIVLLGVASGAVPAFGVYLPAFTAFFLPATLPFLLAGVFTRSPVHQVLSLFMVLLVLGIGGLAIATNLRFKQMVGLRLRQEAMAADLLEQKNAAERANRAKSTFLAAASHDLRQPVHALGLFAATLRGTVLSSEGLRLLDQIEASIGALDGLFAALLDISRLDAGTVEVSPRAFAIAPLIARLCREHLAEAEAKNLRLRWHGGDAVLHSDPVLIERILRNFIANGLRYTETGGVLVACRRRGGHALLQVWDTGIGIPAELQDRIFEEYVQIGNPQRDRAKGLGLGLAIVRRLARLLGQRVTLRSIPGQGSCFEITVPLARSAPEPDEAETIAPAPGRGLVVVVDDEGPIRLGTVQLLRVWGYEPVAAASLEDALRELARRPRPDLVICDYRLRNGESGIDAIEGLRREYRSPIPAMLVTGDTAPERLAEARRSGLLLLHKPVPNARLRAAVTNLLLPESLPNR